LHWAKFRCAKLANQDGEIAFGDACNKPAPAKAG
jgi:hypothetical protein